MAEVEGDGGEEVKEQEYVVQEAQGDLKVERTTAHTHAWTMITDGKTCTCTHTHTHTCIHIHTHTQKY